MRVLWSFFLFTKTCRWPDLKSSSRFSAQIQRHIFVYGRKPQITNLTILKYITNKKKKKVKQIIITCFALFRCKTRVGTSSIWWQIFGSMKNGRVWQKQTMECRWWPEVRQRKYWWRVHHGRSIWKIYSDWNIQFLKKIFGVITNETRDKCEANIFMRMCDFCFPRPQRAFSRWHSACKRGSVTLASIPANRRHDLSSGILH